MEKAKIDQDHSKMTRSAGIVSIAVAISRVLGLLRVAILAYLFPVRTNLDPFYAAYTLPNLLRDLFAEGVLSKAFVATFTNVEARSGEEAAWRLANLVFTALAVILIAITLIGIILSPFIVGFILRGKGFDIELSPESSFGFADKRGLTIYLTQIMFPYLLLISLAAMSMGLLNSKGRFGIPASASSFANVGFLVVGIFGYYTAPKLGQHPLVGMAVGILAGGALQFIIQIPSMWRVGFRYRPALSFTDPDFRQVMKLVAPAMLSSLAMMVNVLVNRYYFASQGDGWVGWNYQAFRLMHFPIGVFGVAISTAALPLLSWRTASQNSMDEYRRTFSYALKMVFILLLPASAGLMALSKPLVSLVLERGQFTPDDTVRVAGSLFCYAFCLCGYSGVMIVRDGFYALKDIRTPVIVRLFTIALNIILNYVFIFKLRIDQRSLAISTACSITVNFLVVLYFLRRRVGDFGSSELVLVFAKSLMAAMGMGVAAALTYRQLLGLLGSNASLLVSIVIAVLVLYGLYRLLRLRELDQISGAIAEKFRR